MWTEGERVRQNFSLVLHKEIVQLLCSSVVKFNISLLNLFFLVKLYSINPLKYRALLFSLR